MSSPPSAAGWVKAKDSQGRTFYANLSNRRTQWTKPDGWTDDGDDDLAPPSGAPPSAATERVGLGRRDGGGRVNPTGPKTTGALRTGRWGGGGGAPAPSGGNGFRGAGSGGLRSSDRGSITVPFSSASSSSSKAATTGGDRNSSAATTGSGTGTGNGAGRRGKSSSPPPYEEPPLPPGWERMTDPGSGRAFYVDHKNKKTTWEHPGAALASASASTSTSRRPAADASGDGRGHRNRTAPSSGSGRSSSPSTSDYVTTGFLSSRGRAASSSSAKSSSAAAPSPAYAAPGKPPPSTSSSSGSSWQRQQKQQPPGRSTSGDGNRPYYDNASMLNGGMMADMDSSSGPPPHFSVVQVRDEDRLECPTCSVVFSIPLRRRHHCRLCGDVFCDSCSSHRCQLPLDGPEFEKPVRVCDLCFVDVDKGNYFSMRRYLSALQLYDHEAASTTDPEGNGARNVAGALSSLSSDLDALLLDSTSFGEKITIPASVLVPAIGRHLDNSITCDRAVRALSTLLALGAVVADDSFAHAVYQNCGGGHDEEGEGGGDGDGGILDSIMKLLEQSGSSRYVLAIQEQAARALFYLSDPKVIGSLVREGAGGDDDDGGQRETPRPGDADSLDGSAADAGPPPAGVDALDVHRALRNMLDHAISSSSPSLQRWAAASIRNLVVEDQRRACLSAEGDGDGEEGRRYEAFTSQLVSTGGVMILCSLMGADDADTRAHATAALSATIAATRAIDSATGSSEASDSDLVSAIVQSGGCGSTLSQLLLSADDAVAGMGCSLASSLVKSLMKEPPQVFHASYSKMKAYQEAAIALATEGGCLPSLIQLLRDSPRKGNPPRPTDLKRCAMETLAAISLACSPRYQPEHGGNDSALLSSDRIQNAIASLEAEGAVEIAFAVFSSSSRSSQSLVSSRDSPSSQLREAAGSVLSGMLSCSPHAANYLRTRHAVFNLLSSAGEEGMLNASTMRGEWAPRCLGMLESAAILLNDIWENCRAAESTTTLSLDCLLESLDSGAVPLLSKIVTTKIEFHRPEKAMGDLCLMTHGCRLVAAMFGIANSDKTSIGMTRLYDAITADAESNSAMWGGYQPSNNSNLITGTVSLLQFVSTTAQNYNSEKYESLLMELTATSLLAVGSMCGAYTSGKKESQKFISSEDFEVSPNKDGFSGQREDACIATCTLLLNEANVAWPSMLIGAFGIDCVGPALRLALAVALNGPANLHPKLAGILVPISDIFQSAFVAGDRYTFSASLALLRYCGPYVMADSGERGGLLSSVRQSISSISNMLMIPVDDNGDSEEVATVEALKVECIITLEKMSTNASLWSAIASDALPAISEYFLLHEAWHSEDEGSRASLCAALRTVQNVIPLPSHAVAASRCGIGTSLARLVCGRKDTDVEDKSRVLRGMSSYREKREEEGADDVQVVALEVLQTLASHSEARRGDGDSVPALIHCGAVDAACFSLGMSAAKSSPVLPKGSDENITKFGLELLHYFVSDLDQQITSVTFDKHEIEHDPAVNSFVDTVARQSRFIRSLCATMLLDDQCDQNGEDQPVMSTVSPPPRGSLSNNSTSPSAVASLYGPALHLFEGPCAGYPNAKQAAVAMLFSIAAFCADNNTSAADDFWATFFMAEEGKLIDRETKQAASTLACANFLTILSDEEEGLCIPRNPQNHEYYYGKSLPMVRERLIEGLWSNLSDSPSNSGSGVSSLLLLEKYQVPKLCLALAVKSPTLLEPVSRLVEKIGSSSKDILSAALSEEMTLTAMFELINVGRNGDERLAVASSRELYCRVLSDFAREGSLGPLVEKIGIRSHAIASLCDACQGIEETGNIKELCMWSLVGILTQTNCYGEEDVANACHPSIPMIDPSEAEAIASSLGRTVSTMVIDRFMDGASLQRNERNVEERDLLTSAPEVKLLCSLGSNKGALSILCRNGGLEALSLVATEGETTAIRALIEQSREDSASVLDVEAHTSVMEVLTVESTSSKATALQSKEIAIACLDFLTNLCSSSRRGRMAIARSDLCQPCIDIASQLICSPFRKNAERRLEEGVTTPDSLKSQESVEQKHHTANTTGSDVQTEANVDVNMSEVEKASDRGLTEAAGVEDAENLADATPKLVAINNLEKGDLVLPMAALSFLTEMIQVVCHRASLLRSRELLETAVHVAIQDTDVALKYKATRFLVMVSQALSWNKDTDQFPVSSLAELFCSILDSTDDEQLLASAAEGLECVLDQVKSIEVLVTLLSSHLLRVVEDLEEVASTMSSFEYPHHGGQLACNISTLFVTLSGNSSWRSILLESKSLMTMLRLILINQGGHRVVIENGGESTEYVAFWEAARTQSLQCIGILLRTESFGDLLLASLQKIGAARGSAATTQNGSVEVDGGSGFEGMDEFVAALDEICREKRDPVASTAAKRILQWIGYL